MQNSSVRVRPKDVSSSLVYTDQFRTLRVLCSISTTDPKVILKM